MLRARLVTNKADIDELRWKSTLIYSFYALRLFVWILLYLNSHISSLWRNILKPNASSEILRVLLSLCSLRYRYFEYILAANIVNWKFAMDIPGFTVIILLSSLSYKSTGALDYSGQGLTAVPSPPANSGTVVDLYLGTNKLESLNETSFTGYDSLKLLDIYHNGLRFIMDGTFINMYQLEKLVLATNRIEQLPSDFGPSAQTLKYLNMWQAVHDNRILSHPYFAAFAKLEWLALGGSYTLQTLTASILPSTLTYVGFNYGSVINFPNFTAYTPLMEHIDIQYNDIKSIPQSTIAQLSMHVFLRVRNNHIEIFPSLVNSLLLEFISMENNQIVDTPRENIEGLTQLRIFRLQYNRLTRMTNISHLTSLEEFNVGYNMISEVSKDIFHGLPNLLKLSCEYNYIDVLPDIGTLLPRLEEFYVQGNRLLTLPDFYYHSTSLTLLGQNNPLVCNRSLCWLRLLTWTNPAFPLSTDSPVCEKPSVVKETPVTRAHPTGMECYNGNHVENSFNIILLTTL